MKANGCLEVTEFDGSAGPLRLSDSSIGVEVLFGLEHPVTS